MCTLAHGLLAMGFEPATLRSLVLPVSPRLAFFWGGGLSSIAMSSLVYVVSFRLNFHDCQIPTTYLLPNTMPEIILDTALGIMLSRSIGQPFWCRRTRTRVLASLTTRSSRLCWPIPKSFRAVSVNRFMWNQWSPLLHITPGSEKYISTLLAVKNTNQHTWLWNSQINTRTVKKTNTPDNEKYKSTHLAVKYMYTNQHTWQWNSQINTLTVKKTNTPDNEKYKSADLAVKYMYTNQHTWQWNSQINTLTVKKTNTPDNEKYKSADLAVKNTNQHTWQKKMQTNTADLIVKLQINTWQWKIQINTWQWKNTNPQRQAVKNTN